MRSAPSLAFDVVPSRIAQLALALMLALAALSVWFSAMPIAAQGLLSLLLPILGLPGLRALRRPPVTRATLQSDGVWLLALAQAQIPATLVASSLLGVLTGLRWRDDASGRTIVLMLWPDSISTSSRRQLRVWLRSGRAHASNSSALNSSDA